MLKTKKLAPSWRDAIITVIPKEGRDPTDSLLYGDLMVGEEHTISLYADDVLL